MCIIKKHKGIINILDLPQQLFAIDHIVKKDTILVNATSYIIRLELPHHQITIIIIVEETLHQQVELIRIVKMDMPHQLFILVHIVKRDTTSTSGTSKQLKWTCHIT